MTQITDTIHGELVDESATLTMAQVCRACGLSVDTVIEYVEFGVVEPLDTRSQPWCFRPSSLNRIKIAVRLTRDLGVNTPGLALALELLDELALLRRGGF